MKNILYPLVLLLSFSAAAQTFPGTFTKKADFPDTACYSMTSFAIGDTMYMVAGADSSGYPTSRVWAYNTAANTWTRKGDMPMHTRTEPVSMTIGGMAYVGLGFNGADSNLSDWWQYNPATDVWTQKNYFPGGRRYGGATFTWSGKGYLIGGGAWDYTSGTAYKDVWEYNAATDIWTQQPDFTGTARGMTFAVVINDTAYFGLGEEDSTHTYFNNMYKYDLVNKTWAPIASIPGTTNVPSVDGITSFAAAAGHKIVLMNNDITYTVLNDLKTIYVYNILTNSWTLYPLANTAEFRVLHGFAQFGNKAYIASGYDENSDIWYTDCWQVDMEALVTGLENTFPELSNVAVSSYQHTITTAVPAALLAQGDVTLDLYSMDGKKLGHFPLREHDRTDASAYPSGVYTYAVNSKGSVVKTGTLSLY